MGNDSSLLNVGFVPTFESASLLIAQADGIFARHGLQVRLCRELGWASAREKLLHGELDATLGPASLLLSAYGGWSGVRQPWVTGLLFGPAVPTFVLANALSERCGAEAAEFASALRGPSLAAPLRLAVASEHGASTYLLRRWLGSLGWTAGLEYRLHVMSAALMPRALATGFLDGFCDSELAGATAELAGYGCPLQGWLSPAACGFETADEEVPAECALIVSRAFADRSPEVHEHLIAALLSASQRGDEPAYRSEAVAVLSRRGAWEVGPGLLENLLRPRSGPNDFRRLNLLPVGEPTRARGLAVWNSLRALTPGGAAPVPREVVPRVFRPDIFRRASRRIAQAAPGAERSSTPTADAEAPGWSRLFSWAGRLPIASPSTP